MKTVTGKECQRWDKQTPHSHVFNDAVWFPDASVEDAENYCRNPGKEQPGGPWCYTTDSSVRWEYCNVENCGISYM